MTPFLAMTEGEQPFALLPSYICRDVSLSSGALSMLAVVASLSRSEGFRNGSALTLTNREWANSLGGCTVRAVQVWRRELIVKELVESEDGWLQLREDLIPEEVVKAGQFARIPLAGWHVWPNPVRRVWIVLWSYADGQTQLAYPSLETLTGETGMSRRTLFRTLARLRDSGWMSRQEIEGRRVPVFALARNGPMNEMALGSEPDGIEG